MPIVGPGASATVLRWPSVRPAADVHLRRSKSAPCGYGSSSPSSSSVALSG
jgi:hypothetical protein